MPNKGFMISWVAVFITLMVYGFGVYQILLGDFYAANAGNLPMRPPEEQMVEWIAIGSAIMAYAFVRIFGHDYQGGGIGEGVRYGLLMGVFFGSMEFISYATVPSTLNVALVGFAASVGMFIASGIVLSLIYGRFR